MTLEENKTFSKDDLQKMLIAHNYEFGNSNYEPSNPESIDKNKLTIEKLTEYLNNRYFSGEKPHIHGEPIKRIIDHPSVKQLIEANRSEYFKILTHFTILSKVKRGWFNLLIIDPSKDIKPSLSANPQYHTNRKSKKLNDAIIFCFYNRLIEGMSEKDKEHYDILLPHGNVPSKFDYLLNYLDLAIQNYFNKANSVFEDEDQYLDTAKDKALNDAVSATCLFILDFLSIKKNNNYLSDTLRASLIKFSCLNRAINDIDAILDIQHQVSEFVSCLEYDLTPLKNIEEESSILPALLDLFVIENSNFPNDLIKCAQLVCLMNSFVQNHFDNTQEDILSHHFKPSSIAIIAAILYVIEIKKIKLNLRIQGETNQNILIYKALYEFSDKFADLDIFCLDDLTNKGFPEPLFKYLTTIYVVYVFQPIPNKESALAYMKLKKYKLKVQRKTYRLLKKISVHDAENKIHQIINQSRAVCSRPNHELFVTNLDE